MCAHVYETVIITEESMNLRWRELGGGDKGLEKM